MCKHNTGVSLLKKYASKAIPSGQKRGRGRPSLALSSLMRQPSIYASILDEDAPEDNNDVDKDVAFSLIANNNSFFNILSRKCKPFYENVSSLTGKIYI